MARKIILDMDPGATDAVALCLAFADPGLEVLAVTATGGKVPPDQATRNLVALVEQIDPPRWPRIGAANSGQYLRTDARHLFGSNGMCGTDFQVAELHHQHPSDKVICDAIRSAPQEVTIVATGPLSNIAAALQREPDLAAQVGHLIILGGTFSGPGNVTAAAEFNIYCDAASARAVFRSRIPKTVIPIDVTERVVLDYGFLNLLPEGGSRSAKLLRRILPGAFQAHRLRLGLEGIYVQEAVAVVAQMHPEFLTTRPAFGDVEIEGELTHGATIIDRRSHAEQPPNMEVAIDIDAGKVVNWIRTGLTEAA